MYKDGLQALVGGLKGMLLCFVTMCLLKTTMTRIQRGKLKQSWTEGEHMNTV